MADDLVEVWRKAMDANLKYYESWGRLAGDWLRELRDAAATLRPTVNLPAVGLPTFTTSVSPPPRAANAPTDGGVLAPHPPAGAARAAVVLEAEPGAVASGALVVENHLEHPVTATVVADPFVDEDGLEVAVEFDALPRTLEIGARASAIVRVHAELPEGAGALRSTLHVPDLPGTSVPVILRPSAER